MERKCAQCGGEMPEGRSPRAIYCSSQCNQKAHYWRHHDEALLRVARQRAKIGPEYFRKKAKESKARRLAENPALKADLRALARIDYWKYRDARLAKNRHYAKTHLELRNVHSIRRRARKAGAEVNYFDERDWHRLKVRYRHCCAYCGEFAEVLHKEHVIPLSRGGRHSVGNILPACGFCNYSKHDSTIMEWRVRQLRIARLTAD